MRKPSFSTDELHEAYLDCRRRKRGTANALRFEMNQAEHLLDLEEELNSGSYRPSRSVCFVNLKPKPREIFAADFRDRVVHHLFVREIEEHWERVFIHDSYACRPGKGTHAAVDRLEEFVRSITRGGRRRAWFLQVDLHNFFMSIDRQILFRLVDGGLRRQYGVPDGKLPLFCGDLDRYRAMRKLAHTLIFHDPTGNYARKSPLRAWGYIPDHKTLFNCPESKGLPIGNLTSQFFGNVYLNPLDQFVKHELKAQRYVRYVDDVVLLHPDRQVLVQWKQAMERFLGEKLALRVTRAEYKGGYRIELYFDDGSHGILDFEKYLERGGVFERFRGIEFFRDFSVNHEVGSLTWSDEVDIAPETLYAEATGSRLPDWME